MGKLTEDRQGRVDEGETPDAMCSSLPDVMCSSPQMLCAPLHRCYVLLPARDLSYSFSDMQSATVNLSEFFFCLFEFFPHRAQELETPVAMPLRAVNKPHASNLAPL